MDECFDQSNKEGPLPVLFFFSLPWGLSGVCVCVCVLGTSSLTKRWKENEGRQPGE